MIEQNNTFCCLILTTSSSQLNHSHTRSALIVHVRVWNPEYPVVPLSYSVIAVSPNKYTVSGLAVKMKSLSKNKGGFRVVYLSIPVNMTFLNTI
jgi:hypothetical protein